MRSSPHVAASLVALSATAAAVHLAVAPAPFAPSSALVIAAGVVLFSVLTAVGLIVVRGRWARLLGMVVAAMALAATAVATEFTAWAILAVVLGLAALGSLTGRWLDGWIRARPSATGPDPRAVVLLLGLLGLVPLVGFAAPSGLEAAHGVLGAAGVLLAWGLGKAQVWALWGTRVVLPALALLTVPASPLPGGVVLLAYSAVLVWLAWTPEVTLAVRPLLDETPGPRAVRGTGSEASS